MPRLLAVALHVCASFSLLFLSFCDFNKREPANVTKPPADARSYTLPDSAYRVSWDLTAVPSTLQAGKPTVVTVRATNLSSSTWPSAATTITTPPAAYCVRLSYRWWDGDRKNVVVDYSIRENLPNALGPNETVTFSVPITPPAGGDYQLQFDLVHELIAWFESKGAAKAFHPVHVQP